MKNEYETISTHGAFACASEQGHQMGLTKREHFAAMAMSGVLANGTYDVDYKTDPDPSFAAMYAVQFADALIEALNK